MKTAIFNSRFSTLAFWDSKNTMVYVNCASIGTALLIIKQCKIEQNLAIERK
jgi:hypothetical protein